MRWWSRKGKTSAAPERMAVGSYEIVANLANASGKQMKVSGYVYSDDDEAQLNARLDLVQRVVDRQRAKAEIPELEAKLDQMLKGIEQAKQALVDLEERNRRGESMTSSERQQINNIRVSVKKMMEEADKGREAIQEAKLKAGTG